VSRKYFFRPVRGLIRLTIDPTVAPWATFLRHSVADKVNVVFCDGHVESPPLPFLFTDTSAAALSRWNRDHQPHRERLSP
jgi:prepilin-type processing-associated H-X9-DG protein